MDCTLCGPRAPKRLKYGGNVTPEKITPQNFSPRNLGVRKHFDIVECDSCGILFSDPVLPAATLNDLYSQSDLSDEPVLESGAAALEPHIAESYRPVLERAARNLSSRRRFVEVGGGTGFVLAEAARLGFTELVEVELSEEARRKFAAPNGARFIASTLEESSIERGSASAVAFFQMLDHVPDPKNFLARVYDCLEPGGQAVCVVHNTRAIPTRLLRRRSPIFHVCHNYLFHPENLTRLFGSLGYENIEAFPIPNAYPLWYWLYLLPLPPGLKRALGKALRAARLDDKTVRLYAGNFAVIARKPYE